jgi:hypothetical protein
VTKVENQHVGCEVIGTMTVWVQLDEIDEQQVENDLSALYAMDELLQRRQQAAEEGRSSF